MPFGRSTLSLIFLLTLLLPEPGAGIPQNVILMIADGMGPEHIAAARAYNGAPLVLESAPHRAQMTTQAVTIAGDPVTTDSGAAATAMATGHKVVQTVISQQIPGDFSDLETSLEYYQARGRRAGLVTNSYIEDATPAAFAAHVLSRIFTDQIVADYLTETRPNVLFGGVDSSGFGINPTLAADAGYTVVQSRSELFALDFATETHVSGQFVGDAPPSPDGAMPYEYDYSIGTDDGYDHLPFLNEMTAAALSILDQDPDGFFLLVEQEHTDRAGHLADLPANYKIERNVFATLEFDRTVQDVLDWIEGRTDPTDTRLIVLADHETGGLQVVQDNGAGSFPTVVWQDDYHTDALVDVFAWGPGSETLSGQIDNTDIYALTILPEPGNGVLLLTGLGLSRLLHRRLTGRAA